MLALGAALPDGTKVIGIGSVNDIAVYRDIVDSGACDYLVKPVTEKALVSALNRTEELQQVNVVERSEENTSELQSLMRISYAVFCLKNKNTQSKTYIAIYHMY